MHAQCWSKRHVNEPHDARKLVPLGVFMSLPSLATNMKLYCTFHTWCVRRKIGLRIKFWAVCEYLISKIVCMHALWEQGMDKPQRSYYRFCPILVFSRIPPSPNTISIQIFIPLVILKKLAIILYKLMTFVIYIFDTILDIGEPLTKNRLFSARYEIF